MADFFRLGGLPLTSPSRGRRFPILPLCGVLTASLVGLSCQKDARVPSLEEQIKQLAATNEDLEKRLKKLELAESFAELLRNADRVAFLTPGASGYSIVRTDLGAMTVSLENIEPYANGSRITLRWGNVIGATVNGVKAKLEWGSVDEIGMPQQDKNHSREITLTDSLRNGTWTNTRFVLDAVPLGPTRDLF